jgi:hypothetical protein
LADVTLNCDKEEEEEESGAVLHSELGKREAMGKRNRSEGRTAAPSTPSISTFAAEEAEPSTSAVPLVVPQKKKLKKLKKSPVEANVTAVQEGDKTAEPSTSVPPAAAADGDDDGPQKKATKERNYGIETKETAMEGGKAGNSEMARLADSSSACPEPVGMQIYWNLSSVNACVREAAAVALAKELESDQQEFEAGGRQEGAAEEVREREFLIDRSILLFGFISFFQSGPHHARSYILFFEHHPEMWQNQNN